MDSTLPTDLKCIKSEHELTFGPNFGFSQIKKMTRQGLDMECAEIVWAGW